jgi:phasin family protein
MVQCSILILRFAGPMSIVQCSNEQESAAMADKDVVRKPPRTSTAGTAAATRRKSPTGIVAEPAAVLSAPSTNMAPHAPKEQPMTIENSPEAVATKVEHAISTATQDVVAKTQAAQEQMAAKVREMMEKNMKSMNEMTEFAKGNVEAMIESAKAAAAGAETLTSHFVESSKKSVEEAQAAFKTISSAKTPNEMMAAQNAFAKAQFDKAVANMSHLSETWMKLAGEVVQPLSNRMALAGEQMKKTVSL